MTKVLIVDDSPFMRTLVRNILAPKGYEIVGEAGDGVAAVEAYKRLKPDLVTMDLVMPNLDGIGALKQIRQMDVAARIVMVSAVGQHTKMLEAMHEGASGYVVKPFQADKMLKEIQAALGVR